MKFAAVVIVSLLMSAVSAETLRGVQGMQDLADFELEKEGMNERGLNGVYDRDLASEGDAMALEEYETYYRALEDQFRYLEEEGDEDEARRLQQFSGAPAAPLAPRVFGSPVVYGANVANARAQATASESVVPMAVNTVVYPGVAFPAVQPAAGGVATAQANANVRGGPYMYNTPLSAAEASALATARSGGAPFSVAGIPAATGTAQAEAAATSGPIVTTGPGGRVTQHSFGDNSYASRTSGPGYTSTTAMAGSPRVGSTTVREGVYTGAGPAVVPAVLPAAGGAATATADASAQTGVAGVGTPLVYGGAPFYAPAAGAVGAAQARANAAAGAVPATGGVYGAAPFAFYTPAAEAAQARARASANTAAGGALPVGGGPFGPPAGVAEGGRPLLENPAGLTYFPATGTAAGRGGLADRSY